MLAAIYHTIHVHTPYKYNAKLFIKNVPTGTTTGEIRSLLTESGYRFGEFGIAWANHGIDIGYNKFESQVKGAYRKGFTKTIDFKDLNKEYDDNGEEVSAVQRF